MKKVISLFLSIVMLISTIACVDLSAYAESSATLDNLETYKAQCFLGIAEDNNSDAVFRCNSLYNYYVRDDIYSPSQSYLDLCYSDDDLMMNYNEWKLYSLAADPSSALDKVVKKEDYYESLIISMFSSATAENDELKKFINNKVIKDTNKFIGTMCNIAKVSDISKLVDELDINTDAGMDLIKQGVEQNYAPAIAGKVSSTLSDIISASNTIYDLSQRISLYGTMAELDDSTKQWINQMYQQCSSSETDAALTTALMNLSMASTDFAGAVLADVISGTFQLSKWAVETTINEGISFLIGGNPVALAVFSGLKAGQTICNIFFNTDDVCEQLYLMECIYKVEDLSRKVIDSCSDTFLNTQSLSNAQSFLYAVDCYYEAIIDLDIDCMEKFLDKLYNGGIIKGNQDDYNEHISALENLRSAREKNYNDMFLYFKEAVKANYPDDYEDYFSNTILLQNIEFLCGYNIRPGYPDGYADVLVGETVNVDVIYYPSNTTQTGYTLESSNSEILKIEGDKATGVSAGTATLTIKSTVNPNVLYSKEIKVGNKLNIDETPAEYFTYTINNDEVTITGLADNYKPENLILPAMIGSYPVTSIGNDAFRNCESLERVIIPNSVTNIGSGAFSGTAYYGDSSNWENGVLYIDNYLIKAKSNIINDSYDIRTETKVIADSAFKNCESLTSVTIPDSVTIIGDSAFNSCTSLTSITIPDSVTSISDWAFSHCTSLTSVTIPDSVTSIGWYAFFGCTSLISVTIGNNVTSIGDWAFEFCDNLSSIDVDSRNPYYASQDGVLFNKDKRKLIRYPDGSARTSYTIPNTVTSIGARAFDDCTNLTSVAIPESVTSIGTYAFYGCSSLTDVYYNGTEEQWKNISIGSNNSDLTTANIHYEAKPDYEYSVLDDGTAYITKYNGDGGDVLIPSEIDGYQVTSIGDWAFWNCSSLTSITIPDSVTRIDNCAFVDCNSLTSITIPDSVTYIGDGAFSGCSSLTSITIPDSVIGIGYSAFRYCSSLTSITIPDGVESIGIDAFQSCDSLTSIVVNENNENYSSLDGVLFNKEKTVLIQFPDGNKSTSYTIPDSVLTIGEGAFNDCNSLTSITIPDSVTYIGEGAFSSCSGLEKIVIRSYYCDIADYESTIPEQTVIYGYPGSTAEAYATEHGRTFEEIPHTHNYVSSITKSPTCTATGVMTYTCTVCGETKTETIAKKAHTYKKYTTKATTSKNGSVVTKCTACGEVTSKSTIYYPKTIKLSATTYTYNGNVQTPTVTVKDSKGRTLKKNTDYTVTYAKGRKYVGKYAVKITFKGNYSGSKTLYFTIIPKATTISSVASKSKGFTVKWKKQTTQTTGYQIQYSTSSKFKSAKTVTVGSNKTTSKSISKLKAKKKYYVRVRTYKTVKVNGKNTKIYSSWSKAKAVTTKK